MWGGRGWADDCAQRAEAGDGGRPVHSGHGGRERLQGSRRQEDGLLLAALAPFPEGSCRRGASVCESTAAGLPGPARRGHGGPGDFSAEVDSERAPPVWPCGWMRANPRIGGSTPYGGALGAVLDWRGSRRRANARPRVRPRTTNVEAATRTGKSSALSMSDGCEVSDEKNESNMGCWAAVTVRIAGNNGSGECLACVISLVDKSF